MSVTTLEEVFIKVGEGSETHPPPHTHIVAPPPYSPSHIPPPDLSLVVSNVEDNVEQQTVTLPFDDTNPATLPGQVPRPSIIDTANGVANSSDIEKRKMAMATGVSSYSECELLSIFSFNMLSLPPSLPPSLQLSTLALYSGSSSFMQSC